MQPKKRDSLISKFSLISAAVGLQLVISVFSFFVWFRGTRLVFVCGGKIKHEWEGSQDLGQEGLQHPESHLVGTIVVVAVGREFALGIEIDEAFNKSCPRGEFADISAKGAKVKTYVIPTNEEYMIALDTLALAEK